METLRGFGLAEEAVAACQSALEFAWRGAGDPPPAGFEWTRQQVSMPWDPDKNGVMEGEQHNTYDIEFYGPNTMTGSLYLAALKATSEMAAALGEADKAEEYLKLFKSGTLSMTMCCGTKNTTSSPSMC